MAYMCIKQQKECDGCGACQEPLRPARNAAARNMACCMKEIKKSSAVMTA